ncbi:hypothetical protein ABKN59_011811 [Abortiporus biennis]
MPTDLERENGKKERSRGQANMLLCSIREPEKMVPSHRNRPTVFSRLLVGLNGVDLVSPPGCVRLEGAVSSQAQFFVSFEIRFVSNLVAHRVMRQAKWRILCVKILIGVILTAASPFRQEISESILETRSNKDQHTKI